MYVIFKHHLISIVACGSVYDLCKRTLKIDTYQFTYQCTLLRYQDGGWQARHRQIQINQDSLRKQDTRLGKHRSIPIDTHLSVNHPHVSNVLLLTERQWNKMHTKQDTASSSSPSSSIKKGTKPSTQKIKTPLCLCSVCLEEIEESCGRKEGHDAIYCDGVCQAWLHRQCAGLSKPRFKLVSESKDLFHCPQCRLESQRDEIQQLKSTVTE